MKLEKLTLRKTCSFYVSDFHLSTLLLPYIVQKIGENTNIVTFLEENIEKNVTKLIGNINLSNKIKDKVLKINWKNFECIKYSKINEHLKINENNINIIVSGKKEYIKSINKNLEKKIKELNQKGLNKKIVLTINNCYQVKDTLNVNEILSQHDMLLNTVGEVKIESVFGNYVKVSNL